MPVNIRLSIGQNHGSEHFIDCSTGQLTFTEFYIGKLDDQGKQPGQLLIADGCKVAVPNLNDGYIWIGKVVAINDLGRPGQRLPLIKSDCISSLPAVSEHADFAERADACQNQLEGVEAADVKVPDSWVRNTPLTSVSDSMLLAIGMEDLIR